MLIQQRRAHRIGIGVHGTDRDVADKGTNLIAGLGVIGRPGHIVGNVVGKDHVGGMVDIGPAHIPLNHGTVDDSRLAILVGAAAMEVDRIPATHVRAVQIFHHGILWTKGHFRIADEPVVIDGDALVRAAHVGEGDKVQIRIIGMHHHHVATVQGRVVF